MSTTRSAFGTIVVVAILFARPHAALGQTAQGRKCTGQNDCAVGSYSCSSPQDSGALHGKFFLEDGRRFIRSDGRGPYAEATGSNVLETATHGAVLLKLAPDTGQLQRSYFVDLNHPLAGAKQLGVIEENGKNGQAWIAAQWRTDSRNIMHTPREMKIGTRVRSDAITVTLHIRGNPYTLQMGPSADFHCFNGKNKVHGGGTSRGTITRTSANTWVVDLPPGSKGRLFDIRGTMENAIDLGLYYTSIRFRLVTDRITFRERN